MRPRTVIFVLSLAVCGTFGCARLVVLPKQQQRPTGESLLPEQSKVPSRDSENPSLLNPSLQASLDGQQIQEEDLAVPIKPAPAAATPTETVKSPVTDKPKSKPLSKRERTPTTLQKTPGPRADDRLLDLVEKDLDKALEQPIQRRRIQFSKEVINHPRVRYFINNFSRRHAPYFAKSLARSGKYFPMIARVLQEEGLPEELAYLALIESNFNPLALSPSDAVGLWQFVPGTARRYGLRINSWVDERRDPVKSTRAAAAYLKDLHAYFGRWYLATAAYNAGQGAIERALQTSGATDFWSLSEKAKLSDETRNFVPKFVAASLIASNPNKYGFTSVTYETPLMYEEVEVRGYLQLALAAEMAGTDMDSMQELNPELLKAFTPPGESGFRLKIPAGHATAFVHAYQEHRDTEPIEVVMHEVRKGDTLYAIARRYGLGVRSLMKLNGLKSSRLRIGQQLTVILRGLNQPR